MARDVVGMRMRLERAHDAHVLLLGRDEVLLDRVGGVDDDRFVRLFVADEIRRTAEVVVDELPEDHVPTVTPVSACFLKLYGWSSHRRSRRKTTPPTTAAPPITARMITNADVPEPPPDEAG